MCWGRGTWGTEDEDGDGKYALFFCICLLLIGFSTGISEGAVRCGVLLSEVEISGGPNTKEG